MGKKSASYMPSNRVLKTFSIRLIIKLGLTLKFNTQLGFENLCIHESLRETGVLSRAPISNQQTYLPLSFFCLGAKYLMSHVC